MTTGTIHRILAGALAAGLILAAPLTATAAAPTHVSASALYDGVQVPSTKAELKQYASVADHAPVYSEPTSSNLSVLLPKTAATGGAKDQIRVSEPFAARDEQWVAVQVPEAAHGSDSAKSTLAEAGVAYVSAIHVTIHYQYLSDGPTGDPTAAAPSAAAQAYPTQKSDLVTTARLTIAKALLKRPVDSWAEELTGTGSPTDKWGSTVKSSELFVYEGKQWIAVEASEGLIPGGVAYVSADMGVTVKPVTAAATPSAASTAAPRNDPAPSSSPAAAAPANASPTAPQSNFFADAIGKVLSLLPAVLFAALVMAGTLTFTKRRPA